LITINLAAHRILPYDGYGRLIKQLMHAMLVSGDFDIHPLIVEQLEWETWMQNAAGIDHSRLTLSIMPGHELRPIPARQWAYSMYECTRLPDKWAENINSKAERLIVPCEWCEQVFIDNGVTVPTHVVYGGVDPNECTLLPEVRRGTRPYTFMALADRGNRKGWDTVLNAFADAFRPDDNVALIVKARTPELLKQFPVGYRDPVMRKVRFWTGDVDNVRDVFAHADCIVYPATADGWGMFPREAACCGLPVIATEYSGTAVGCEQWAYPLRDYRLVDSADLPYPDRPGKWARARSDEVAHYMRFCFDHPDEARHKGLAAAAWLRENQTWAHSARALRELITDIDVTRPQAVVTEWERQEQDFHNSTERLAEIIRGNGHGS
jgi:glycosyltransferase involved in cell wall biosynthesis